jgi:molecular chaperone DnaK (HSP70)
MHYYTYAYLREDRTPYYIGKGTRSRIYSTNRRVHPPKDRSRIIYLKQNLTEEEAFRHEIYMIDVFGRIDLGTGILHNRTDGGDGVSGYIPSEETRKRMSDVHKGENHHMYGKTHSEETRRKIGEGNKNKILTEETKKRMSESQKGHTVSEETRIKLSEASKNPSEETRRKRSEAQKGEKNHNYGKTASEESRKKMSDASKNPSEETRRKLSEASKGRKWWNDGCGNCKMMIECPGDDWRLGRK